MSDIKLFRIEADGVGELEGKSMALEKSLQTLIEQHLDALLGVRFLASEYSTGNRHGGRIDTLGIDENGCPVIIEYKRATNENVINQGLFYLDWLMDHKAEFELLVLRQIGQEDADGIEWSTPRLLCIAGDFTKYDEHAVQQINRNIELIRYRHYADGFLLLELVNAVSATPTNGGSASKTTSDSSSTGGVSSIPMVERLPMCSHKVQDLYEAIRAYMEGLGDDVQVKPVKYYIAFKRLKNFATLILGVRDDWIVMYLKVNPESVAIEEGFTRDMRNIGHHGYGDLEVTISSLETLEKAKPLLNASYEAG